ncbi:carboxylesterase 4A-like [Bacillus rossius redtenbacheri]|uniref:carboxylesterase 4A-like n=1 Tax=Bacillus rossius redtenbacheri TaxID=93214 RepID=UPI002FDD5DDA
MWCGVQLALALLAAAAGAGAAPEVLLPGLGAARGSSTASRWRRRPVFQFQGLPFARPPTGRLRFKPPEPPVPWDGVLDATKFNRKCPTSLVDSTYDVLDVNDTGHPEDCLHINVYTPSLNTSGSGLPVMVFFHGGSFRVGSARDFRPEFLLDRDILLVVPQYRLGPLGFLCLQTEDVPGNVGLLDHISALRWVQSYIHHFGGDPGSVTVFGQSAGGASVTLLMVSPLVEQGLFSRVIAQSGSAYGTWVMDPEPVEHARSIATLANCSQQNLTELASCLREVDTHDLLNAHSSFLYRDLKSGGRGTGGNHVVVQEESVGARSRFLVEQPAVSFAQGRFHRVPLMGGVTKHEGSFILGNIYDIILQTRKLTHDFEYLSRNLTRDTLRFGGIEDATGMVEQVLVQKYFHNGELGYFDKMTPGLVDICGVALLKASTFRMVQENSRARPSYMYSFNYHGRHTMFGYGEEVDYPFPGGVAHSDDLIYLFPHDDKNLSGPELAVARTMVQLWTNFAATGSPAPAEGVPAWPPIADQKGPYLRIDAASAVGENFLDEYLAASLQGLAYSSSSSSAAPYSSVAALVALVVSCGVALV